MLPDETGGKYVAALSQVLAPLQYRLQIGDTQTQLYKVAVYERPTVAQVEAAYEFPAYLERPRETVKQNQGDLEAPQFTPAELRIHPSAPIARGHLMIEGQAVDGQVADDGKTLVAQLLLKDTTTYTIHLFTAGGHSDPQPRVNQVKVVTDAPPTVQLVEPARETTIAVGTKPNVVEKGKDAKAGNRIIRFTMNEDVAGSTGVLYYSNFFPVEEGATYRFQCRWRTTGLAAKVFIKCSDELPTSFRTREGGDSLKTEKREVYRSQQNLQGSAGAWNVQTEDFTPQHTQFTPRWGQVVLYAYWPAGSVEWDDVVVKQIAPVPPRKREKDPRPSTETKVRTREMEEDTPATLDPIPATKKSSRRPGRLGAAEPSGRRSSRPRRAPDAMS